MDKKPVDSFAIQISRELGNIESRLEGIESAQKLAYDEHRYYMGTFEQKVDSLRNEVILNTKDFTKDIAVLKTKAGVIAVIITFLVNGLMYFAKSFAKN